MEGLGPAARARLRSSSYVEARRSLGEGGGDIHLTSALGSRAAAALGSPTKRSFGLSSSVLALGPQPNAKVAGLRCILSSVVRAGSLERPPTRNPSTLVGYQGALTVRDIVFDRATILVPTLTPQHHRMNMERTAGPVLKLVESLAANDPPRLAAFRREYDALAAEYFEHNMVRQDYLMTRAAKSDRPGHIDSSGGTSSPADAMIPA